MAEVKIGITERGDPSQDFSWYNKLDDVDGAILISKNITDPEFQKLILDYKHKIILHANITFLGYTKIEPNVPNYKESIAELKNLLKSGFPVSQVVYRFDPIIYKNQLNMFSDILPDLLQLGISRFRFSFIDFYPHVRDRFQKAELPLPYTSLDRWQLNPKTIEDMSKFLDNLGKQYNVKFSSCGENLDFNKYSNIVKQGCVSLQDLDLLNLPHPNNQSTGRQRPLCSCLPCKTELLSRKQPCAHKCLYCYWKD